MADHTARFGRSLGLEDASGNVAENAFAALSTLYFDAEEGVIRIGMKAWRDAEAYDAGKAPLKLAPDGDLRLYYLNGARYSQAIAMQHGGVPAAKIITDLVWQVVRAIKDVQVEPPSADNPDGVYKSFFEDVTDLQSP